MGIGNGERGNYPTVLSIMWSWKCSVWGNPSHGKEIPNHRGKYGINNAQTLERIGNNKGFS